jgi:hypothetical protein
MTFYTRFVTGAQLSASILATLCEESALITYIFVVFPASESEPSASVFDFSSLNLTQSTFTKIPHFNVHNKHSILPWSSIWQLSTTPLPVLQLLLQPPLMVCCLVISPRENRLTSAGSVPLRLELRDLEQNQPDQWNLYLLGLDAFKKLDETQDLSYYGIAGK